MERLITELKSGGRVRFKRLQGEAVAFHLLRKVLIVHPGEAQYVLDVPLFERGHHALLRIAERKVRVKGSLAPLFGRLQGDVRHAADHEEEGEEGRAGLRRVPDAAVERPGGAVDPGGKNIDVPPRRSLKPLRCPRRIRYSIINL